MKDKTLIEISNRLSNTTDKALELSSKIETSGIMDMVGNLVKGIDTSAPTGLSQIPKSSPRQTTLPSKNFPNGLGERKKVNNPVNDRYPVDKKGYKVDVYKDMESNGSIVYELRNLDKDYREVFDSVESLQAGYKKQTRRELPISEEALSQGAREMEMSI